MKIALTEKVVLGMVERAKNNFINSKAEPEHKEILTELPVYVYLSNRMIDTLGLAWCARYYKDKNIIKTLKLKFNQKRIIINKISYYPILQLNRRFLVNWEPKLVYEIVSHELAHLLDYNIRGYEYVQPKYWHDEFWQYLHKNMKGKATEKINLEKYQTSTKGE